MLKIFQVWFKQQTKEEKPELSTLLKKDDLEELRLAINDLAYQQAVLRTLVGRPSTEPKWDEQRIVNLELAHDPLHETIWAAIRGLQSSTVDAAAFQDLRTGVDRLTSMLIKAGIRKPNGE